MSTTTATPNSPLDVITVDVLGHPCFAVVTPEDGVLHACGFDDLDELTSRLPQRLLDRGLAENGEPEHPVRVAIQRYAAGDVTAIDGLVVEQEEGPFHAQARLAMRRIAPGMPVTYTELAESAGRPAAVRAAASACARNLVALVVPCHRVVRNDGGLGGYYYGVDLKEALLAHERANA